MVNVRKGSIIKIHMVEWDPNIRKVTEYVDNRNQVFPLKDIYPECEVVCLNALGCDIKLPDGEYKTISLNSITEVIRY